MSVPDATRDARPENMGATMIDLSCVSVNMFSIK